MPENIRPYNLENIQKEEKNEAKLQQRVESDMTISCINKEGQLEQKTKSIEKPLDEGKVNEYIELLKDIEYAKSETRISNVIKSYKENPSRELEEAAVRSMIAQGFRSALVLQKKLQLPNETIQHNLELQSFLKKTFSHDSHNYSSNLTSAIEIFPMPEGFWQTPELQEALKKYWDTDTIIPGNRFEIDFTCKMIREYLPKLVKTIFSDSKLFIADEGVQFMAKSLINTAVNNRFAERIEFELAADITSFFQIDKDDPTIQPLLPKIEKGILKGISDCLNYPNIHINKRIDGAFRALEIFGFSKELAEDLGKEIMLEKITAGSLENAKIIKETFRFPDAIIIDLFNIAQKERKWDSVIKLANQFPVCKEFYKNAIEDGKEIISTSRNAIERKKAIEMFAGLIINGDIQFVQDLIVIVLECSKDQKAVDTKTGFTPVQEAAFAVIYRLDMPESNNALYSLLSSITIAPAVKRSTLIKLTKQGSSFLDEHSRTNLRRWLQTQELNNIHWEDLSFIQDIENISAGESRKVAKLYASEVIAGFNQESCYEVWAQQYPNIPKDTFLQICKFLQANPRNEAWDSYRGDVMEKFQILYKSLRKEGSKKDLLLASVTGCHDIHPELLDLVVEKLSDINFEKKEDADKIAKILKLTAFLNSIQNITEDSEYEKFEHRQRLPFSVPDNIKEIFLKPTANLSELENLLSGIVISQIKIILPNESLTVEKIHAIEKKWSDLEPIFTYLKRFPRLKRYVAEIIANIDTEENWKNYRYNLEDETVKKQINYLNPEQLELWKNDYFAELGNIMITESITDKPQQISKILGDAILTHQHIYNPELDKDNKNEFIQNSIVKIFAELEIDPTNHEKIIKSEIENISKDNKQIDILILASNLSRIEQSLSRIFVDENIQPTKETEKALGFLSSFLPKELHQQLLENYKATIEYQGKTIGDEIIYEQIASFINNIKKESKEVVSKSDIWGKYNLDKTNIENPENIKKIYKKRQELRAMVDLLHLCNLSNKLIATNKINEKDGEKGGEDLTQVLERLKKYFANTAILQDLKNIEFILTEKQDLSEKRKLAMIFTDDPQILWQVGKYPLGCGSCQHYAEGSYADNLMGYVGDANCKVAYLIDLNKLPNDLKKEIDEKSFEEIKDKIPAQDLLNASIARSIIKMTKDQKNKPVILLEPTYSSVNKGDLEMDKYFNIFIDLMIAEPGKMKMARGGGNEQVTKGFSRSPEGQYEDLNLSSVKYIHRLSKPTEEEAKIIERIRSSR
jgi:hypothetical protein